MGYRLPSQRKPSGNTPPGFLSMELGLLVREPRAVTIIEGVSVGVILDER